MLSDLDPAQLNSFLKTCNLFQEVDDSALEIIVKKLELMNFKKGEPIVLENEISDHVYFVYSGTVEVVKQIPELKQMHRLAVLHPGHQFSDFSVLNRANKTASVYALEDCVLLRMSGENFIEVLRNLPLIAKNLVIRLAQMTRQIQTSQATLKYVQNTDITLHTLIPQILPPKMWRKFNALPIKLVNRSFHLAVKDPQNDALVNFIHGTQPNLQLYFSLVNDADFDAFEKDLTTAYQDAQRSGGIKEKKIPTLPPIDLRTSLKSISLFQEIPDDWVEQFLSCFQTEIRAPGEYVFKAGTPSDRLFMVLSGSLEISSPIAKSRAATFITAYGPGDYFAEVSLLTNNNHILNARATTELQLASLSKEYFDRLLDAPFFSIPLARDLASQFQIVSKATSYKLFDTKKEIQVKALGNLLPASVIQQYEILPLHLVDNELTIGITNPESETIYSVIARYLQNYRISLEIIKPADFNRWVKELDGAKPGGGAPVGRPTSANIAKADSVSVLNKVLQSGFDGRASDIHMEPTSENFVIRYRIDGVLVESDEKYSKELGSEVINRIKILCGLDVTNKFTPQDGQMKFDLAGSRAYARVSTLPTKNGENVVLRLIRQRQNVPPLAMVAPDRRVISLFRDVVHTKQGVFLVTGPTGSGKSTTLYSLLQELNRVETSIISLEDPVELEIAGITQVEMNEKQGLNFANSLRSALRQDPNVIMIGEIRDEESAKIAFHAASTGHLVISTLHTNDSINIVPRLVELGVSYPTLASTLIGASAQRLLRKVCGECRSQRPISTLERDVLAAELPNEKIPETVSYGKGCTTCKGKGYHDRLPVIEIWKKTKSVELLLLNKGSVEEIAQELRSQGFDTLREFALKMVLNGLTTVEEVHRALGLGSYDTSGEKPSAEMPKAVPIFSQNESAKNALVEDSVVESSPIHQIDEQIMPDPEVNASISSVAVSDEIQYIEEVGETHQNLQDEIVNITSTPEDEEKKSA